MTTDATPSRRTTVLATLSLPPGQLTDDERWALHNRVEQLVGWAKSGKTTSDYLMSIENVDQLRFDIVRAVEDVLASRGEAT